MPHDYERVLRSVTEYEPAELVSPLSSLAYSASPMLNARHILGPTRRYTDPQMAEKSIETLHLLEAAGVQRTFVILGESEEPKGLATIHTGIDLHKLRIPAPMGVTQNRVADWLINRASVVARLRSLHAIKYPYATHNLTAWVGDGDEELLAKAYKEMYDKVVTADVDQNSRPWTIEPFRSPRSIHDAIALSGLQRISRGWFDDQDTRRMLPTISVLYARNHYEWMTHFGQLKELRKGKLSAVSDIHNKQDETARRLNERRQTIVEVPNE